jgi:hypothetical protein
MKTTIKLFGTIALVVIVVFTLGSCVINVPNDEGDSVDYDSINGVWGYDNGTTRITISGSTGTLTTVGNNWNTRAEDAVNKGHIYRNMTYFRQITKDTSRDRTWRGQHLLVSGSGNNATGTGWSPTGTFTLDSRGREFVFSSTDANGVFTTTYVRK